MDPHKQIPSDAPRVDQKAAQRKSLARSLVEYTLILATAAALAYACHKLFFHYCLGDFCS